MTVLNEGQTKTLLPPPKKPKRFTFHAAFSYSSADAELVGKVGRALPKGITVHDYKTPKGIIRVVGLDLRKTLKRIYKYEAMFVFAFISKTYAKKDSEYTQLEWKVAKRVAKRKPGYVIPVLLEETEMSVTDAWLDGRLPIDQLADLIEGTIRRPPPEPWWFHVSREAKVAAAAALLALVLLAYPVYKWFWPSRTSLKSADASAQAIIAHVANDGPKSSTLVGQRLKFGALPIEDKDLGLGKSESATIAPGERDVKLTTLELVTKCGADGIRPNKHTIDPLLNQQDVTLQIDIRESDDAPGHFRKQTKTFPAAHLKPLVERLVSGRDTPCD
jgi:hypothetical protein